TGLYPIVCSVQIIYTFICVCCVLKKVLVYFIMNVFCFKVCSKMLCALLLHVDWTLEDSRAKNVDPDTSRICLYQIRRNWGLWTGVLLGRSKIQPKLDPRILTVILCKHCVQ